MKIVDRLFKYFTILVYLFLFAPLGVVVLMSFHPDDVAYFPIPYYSLRWYAEFTANEPLLTALRNSLTLAITVAFTSATIATLISLGLVRYKFRGKSFLSSIILSPIIVPGLLIGLGLLTLFDILNVSRSFFTLVIAHTVVSLPYTIIVIQARLYGFDRSLEEAAMNLGANELEAFFDVTLPLIAPGIIAGMLFAFTISLDDFSTTISLVTPDTITLPITVYGMIRTAINPQINVVGTLMVLATIAIPLLGEIISGRRR